MAEKPSRLFCDGSFAVYVVWTLLEVLDRLRVRLNIILVYHSFSRAVVIVLPCYGALEIVGVIIIIIH